MYAYQEKFHHLFLALVLQRVPFCIMECLYIPPIKEMELQLNFLTNSLLVDFIEKNFVELKKYLLKGQYLWS